MVFYVDRCTSFTEKADGAPQRGRYGAVSRGRFVRRGGLGGLLDFRQAGQIPRVKDLQPVIAAVGVYADEIRRSNAGDGDILGRGGAQRDLGAAAPYQKLQIEAVVHGRADLRGVDDLPPSTKRGLRCG